MKAINISTNLKKTTNFGLRRSLWAKRPALTQTCRQIRAESLPIYYGRNHFVFFCAPRGTELVGSKRRARQPVCHGFEEWLAVMQPGQLRMIANIEALHTNPAKLDLQSTPYFAEAVEYFKSLGLSSAEQMRHMELSSGRWVPVVFEMAEGVVKRSDTPPEGVPEPDSMAWQTLPQRRRRQRR